MMKKVSITRNRGITIVELLVYMGLLSIFLILLINVLVGTLSFKLQSESTSALNQDMRYILGKLSYDLYNADSVESPLNFGDTSASLTLTSGGVSRLYTVDSEDLILTIGGVASKLNGTDTKVQSISFEKLGTTEGKPTVQIIITLESPIVLQGNRTETRTVQTTYGLR
jgi:type II secretory pathway pseudopilin PulG